MMRIKGLPLTASLSSDFSSRASSSYTGASTSTTSSSASHDVGVGGGGGRSLRRLFSCFSPSVDRSLDDPYFGDELSQPPHLTPPSENSYGKGRRIFNKSTGNLRFTITEILKSTNNFSPNYKIGQGGSGMVYKAKLSDGTLVAVKRAKKSAYDRHMSLEIQNEIQTMQLIDHANLVKFYGKLEFNGEQIIVVEFVPNGNLREHIDCLNGKKLDFSARLDIAIDVAHAVTYLHTYSDTPFIHRDIKSSNILLTDSLRAKVADFGFAKRAPTEAGVSHISTQVKGTAGYLDPEYLRTYQLTEKSDVYSFGVLLVELVTGRRPIEPRRDILERITAKWAMEKFAHGKSVQTLDPNLPEIPATSLAVEKIYELALQCLAPARRNRPRMKRCAEILWNIRKDYRGLLSN